MVYFRSPGRINLIGEHTDYNGGYVLPAAIDRYTYIGVEPSSEFKVYSHLFKEGFKFDLNEEHEKVKWLNYVKGAIFHLSAYTHSVFPVKIEIFGDLPIGVGLSSSASLMVGIIYAISRLQRLELSRKEVADLAHEAEKNFVGVDCGIMDQYAVSLSRKDNFLLINTLSREFSHVEVSEFPNVMIIDSGVKHDLAESEYNVRRNECRTIERLIGKKLAAISPGELSEFKTRLSPQLYKRALHVVGENERVLKAVKAIEEKSWTKLGSLLYESHNSLSELYEVSTTEIDYIVTELKKVDGVYGARIVGGGFGGGVLVLFKGNLTPYLYKMKSLYEKNYDYKMDLLRVKIGTGVRKVPEKAQSGDSGRR